MAPKNETARAESKAETRSYGFSGFERFFPLNFSQLHIDNTAARLPPGFFMRKAIVSWPGYAGDHELAQSFNRETGIAVQCWDVADFTASQQAIAQIGPCMAR